MIEEVPNCDCNIEEAINVDLQRQIVELTHCLEALNLESQIYDHDSSSNFKNLFHNHDLFREYHGKEERGGDLSFKVDLPEFSGTLQAEGFIDWLYKVAHIFYYKDIPYCMKVKLDIIKLKG